MSVPAADKTGSTARGRGFLLALPLLLTPSTALAFVRLSRWLGDDAGYVLGFAVYWLWCLAVPLAVLGRRGACSVLSGGSPLFRRRNWLLVVMLALTVVGAVVMYFLPGLGHVSLGVVLFSPVAIVTGTLEEVLNELGKPRHVALIGPSTPLCEEIFRETPVTHLGGSAIVHGAAVLEVIDRGGGTPDMRPCLRFVNIMVHPS